MKIFNRCLIVLTMGLTWSISNSAFAADTLAPDGLIQVMEKTCQVLNPTHPLAQPGRIQDLELAWAALGFEALGKPRHADAIRQYLRDYYEQSPLVKMIPPTVSASGLLTDYNPSPAYSRLVRSLATNLLQASSNAPAEPWGEVLKAQVEDNPAQFAGFVQRFPDSGYAGWFVYQTVWLQSVQEQSTDALAKFSREHPDHPLAQEAQLALPLQFFAPDAMARLSGLLPGLGEETLEPGLREASTFMYSELIYALGTIGFVVASQVGARAENVGGALLLANLLMLNHRASSENAFELATRRNQALARKFMQARLTEPVRGSGTFTMPHPRPAEVSAPVDHLLFSVELPWSENLADFHNRGWVHEEQLANLGFRLDYLQGLWDLGHAPGWGLCLGLAPWGHSYANHVARLQDSPLPADVQTWDLGAGLEGWLRLRFPLGDTWMQVRLAGGPAWRDRKISVGENGLSDHGLATSASAALAWGGESGTFWQVGYSLLASRTTPAMNLSGVTIRLADPWQAMTFGLGLRF